PGAGAAGRGDEGRDVREDVDEAHDRRRSKADAAQISNDPALPLWRAHVTVARARRPCAHLVRPVMARSPSDLRAAARAASYTPPVADGPALVALAVAEEADAGLARALGGQGAAAVAAARAALAGAVAPVRARLVRLLDRLGAPAEIFVTLAGDADPKAS